MKKLAVITGSSRGIGFELARVFGENGFDLVINSETDIVFDAEKKLKSLGYNVTAVKADLSTREGADEFFERTMGLGGDLHSVVINAGFGVGGTFLETDIEREIQMMNLNMVYLTYLSKKFLKEMNQRGSGKLLLTSSVAGEMPGPYYAVYAATKAFVQSFAEAIRYEMNELGTGITVTALQPGATDTNFFKRAGMENTNAGEGDKDDPRKVALAGYEALMNGDDHVVVGMKNKIMTTAGKIMPQTAQAKAQGQLAKPDSLQQ